MSTPLSGSLLHLEVASRALGKDTAPDLSTVRESLRVAQEELLRGSAWLESLTEACVEAPGEPAEFSLAKAVRRGAEGPREQASRRGLGLELPPAAGRPVLFGSHELFEQAVGELTKAAIGLSAGCGLLRWTVEMGGGGCQAALLAPMETKEMNLERSVLREAGPLLARWAVEAHGGSLTLERQGSDFSAILCFPETA